LLSVFRFKFCFPCHAILLLQTLAFSQAKENIPVRINEFLASNASVNLDPDFQNFSDWLELYNSGDGPVDLGGMYLSNDVSNPGNWRIPDSTIIEAYGFLVIWADGMDVRSAVHLSIYDSFPAQSLHVNFKLDEEKEQVGLFDRDGLTVDTITFNNQFPDISYGRKKGWLYFDHPTPGAANTTRGLKSAIFAPAPEFSHSGGRYLSPQTITLASSAGDIFYSTDGSMPDESSVHYQTPIPIDSTTVIRARTVAVDLRPKLFSPFSLIIPRFGADRGPQGIVYSFACLQSTHNKFDFTRALCIDDT
jgi:hypothetical protein